LAHLYRFGQVEIRPSERQLLVEGRPARLGARAFDVLLALIDHRDRVVTKNELFDLVWPGLVVEENNLHVQISTLRKVLGAQCVATIPGRGFRFTPQIEMSDSAPACPLPARKHNLPALLNSFIGREREMAELKELLRASRLVTLTGTGGTGKSRLSLQVAYDLLGEYPDGIWLVELAPLADEQRVPLAVASVLGVKEDAGRPVIEALVRYVRERRLLVILDNCEHVVQACAELAKVLLQSGAGVKILASSREYLQINGEATYPVPALAVPSAREAVACQALAANEAVRLFVDRAIAVQYGFHVTEQNCTAVAEICRRLDGIPLAIELAAARVRALPPEQIAARLKECFNLLTGGDTTALPRQQTLRASIDWSYDLLSISERELFRRLAVFAGGWTAEAAEAVCTGGDVDKSDLLELLTCLVEKSLVAVDANGERYHLLETVRQYGLDLLTASGESDAVRGRHLSYYLDLAVTMDTGLCGPAQAIWMARLDAERENLLSAHAWCDFADCGAEGGLHLACMSRMYWISSGLLGLGHRIVVEALARGGAQQRNEARCAALFTAGQYDFYMGRYGDARRFLEESLAIARELRNGKRIAFALQPLGMACLGQGNLAMARSHLEEALGLARELGNKRELAAALCAVGQLYRIEGALDEAELLYENVLSLAVELGDEESRAIGLLNLAMVAICRCAEDRAREMLMEVIQIAKAIGSQRVGLSAIEVSAGMSALCQDWERAALFFGSAESQTSNTGIHRDPVDEAFLAPLIEGARSALGSAGFSKAEAAGRALTYEEAMSKASAWLQKATA
jgi:predicted ATPase/DNA-binding winged helix-turn-helix (wHTH) protein